MIRIVTRFLPKMSTRAPDQEVSRDGPTDFAGHLLLQKHSQIPLCVCNTKKTKCNFNFNKTILYIIVYFTCIKRRDALMQILGSGIRMVIYLYL